MTPDRWEQINRLYHAALEIEEKERTSFLEAACKEDAELRSEVQSLLAMHEQVDGFLGKPAVEEVARDLRNEPPSLLGRQLGPYHILGVLGAGGMGEVYKAKDGRLNRTVAIKVLPRHLWERADLRQRFEREARAIAGLNHPNICALHDIGREDGIDFLVMEYLEGETLSKRLKRGPLPVEEVLRYAIQVSKALAQAHRSGVVHRDLKPGNIMLTRQGAKLLDFGLAKRKVEAASSRLGPSAGTAPLLSTESESLTEEGMLLGTLEYMAPEQVEGKQADHRTDIFALGVVIYEMATGRKAFEGDSKASLTAAILTAQPPPITAIQPLTPPALERLVKKCLNKDPEERWQSTSDLATELEWLAETATQPTIRVSAEIQRRRRERLVWAIALVLLCVAAWFLGRIYTRRPVSEARAIRFIVPPPRANPTALFASISPDGQKLAIYDGEAIWIRPLRSTQPYRLTEAGNVVEADVFWSPDSRSIAFWEIQPLYPGVEEATLKKIEITGGATRTICETSWVSKPTLLGNTACNGTWSPDGIILFERGEEPKGISQVSAEGGTPLPVTTVNESRQEMDHVFPHFLPDGRHFLYTVTSKRPEVMGIYIGSVDSPESRRLLDVDAPLADFAYAAPGYLLYERGRRLLAHRFDAKSLSLSGEPISLEDQPFRHPLRNNMLSVSENGTLCYLVGPLSIPAQVTKFDRTGKRIDTIGPPGDYPHIELSPDGTKLAVAENRLGKAAGDSGDLYLFDLQQGIKTRLTKAARGEWNYGAVWSPDGRQILFTSNRDKSSGQPDSSQGNLYLKATTKDGAEKALLQSSQWKAPQDWSRDGRFIIYLIVNTAELWMLPLFGPQEPKLFLPLGQMARFSPDGRWVAYQDLQNLYVCSFPSGEGRRQISSDGGMMPRWRDDGKELFYFTPDRKLMSLQVKTGSGFQLGSPKVLFENISVSFEDRPSLYDVSPDGQYFYISTSDSALGSPQIQVVVNWAADLPKR